MNGTKHLIQCHCVLPQFKNKDETTFHKFVVFSIFDDNDNIMPHLARCNNCDMVHKIIDVCRSEFIYTLEDTDSILTKNDFRRSVPSDLCKILDENMCDIATWENAKFILENELWGQMITLTKDDIGDSSQIKILTISNKNKFKISTHLRQDEVMGEYSLA